MRSLFGALGAIVVLDLTGSHLCAQVQLRGSPEEVESYLLAERQFVTVTESASKILDASSLAVIVRIAAEGQTDAESLAAHRQAQERFVAKLAREGIERERLKLPNFAQLRDCGDRKGTQGTLIQSSTDITIDLKTQDEYLALVRWIGEEKAATLQTCNFENDDEDKTAELVFTTACNQLKKRREAYESNLGVTLKVVSFKETEHGRRPGGRFGQIVIASRLEVTFEIIPPDPPEALVRR